jgi:surfeit locus 1 family protein
VTGVPSGARSPFYGQASFWAASVLAAALLALTVSLGTWQLNRASEKQALQQARDRALAEAPLVLDASVLRDLAAGPAALQRLDGRRVRVEGVFDAQHSVLLDNRTQKGVAGFHVLTPMRLADHAQVVMVLRGWVARDPRERLRLPEVPTPAGVVRIEGLAMGELQQPMLLSAEPDPGPQDRIWQHYDAQRFARWAGLPVAPLIVRQTVDAPDVEDALDRGWNLPGSGVDKHHGYAFQWFAMAAAVVAGWGWFLRRGLSGRRGAHQESGR